MTRQEDKGVLPNDKDSILVAISYISLPDVLTRIREMSLPSSDTRTSIDRIALDNGAILALLISKTLNRSNPRGMFISLRLRNRGNHIITYHLMRASIPSTCRPLIQ